jgi:hypothetical protein
MNTIRDCVLDEYATVNIEKRIQERVFVVFGKKYRSDIVKSLHFKMFIVDLLTLLLAWLGGLTAFFSCENNMKFTYVPADCTDLNCVRIDINDDSGMRTSIQIVRAGNVLITIALMILLFFHYKFFVSFQKMKMNLKPEDSLYSSGYWKYMIIEMILNLPCTPPWSDEPYITIPQRNTNFPPAKVFLDNVLTIVLLFCRSYHIVKVIAFHSKYNTYENEKICLECNTPMNYIFLIKGEFKKKPILMVGMTLLVSIFIFGYSVRSIEMFFMFNGDPGKTQDWRYYWNGMWCVIITMATVGFGDFYPISLMGRAIIVISSFWGTFLISLMVAALTLSVEFNPQENVAYETLKQSKAKIIHGKIGVLLLQGAWRYFFHVNKLITTPNLNTDPIFRYHRSMIFLKLKKAREIFRSMKKDENEKFELLKIENAVKRIDECLTIDMDKIKGCLPVVREVRALLNTYIENQMEIKRKARILYREIEEVSAFKKRLIDI